MTKPARVEAMLSSSLHLADDPRGSSRQSSRTYRVLMIAPTSFFADYGCHVRILEEARILQQLGHRVTVATYHNGGAAPGLDIRRTMAIPWRREYEVGSSRHKIVFDALLGLKLTELMARERYDVIHAHLHEAALMALVLGRMFRLPMVFDYQGSMTSEMLDHHFLRQGSHFYRSLLGLETWINRASPFIFTSSANAECLLVEQFQCDPRRVRTLPDAVNADMFKPAEAYPVEQLTALRRELQIPPERRLIVYLGLLAEYQGTGLLLEALRDLVARREDVHLLMMGFPNLDRYMKRASELGVRNHVTFTGRVPYQRAPEYLALGDVAVSAKVSLTEGAGKLLNYMACALPTVAFDTPVAREYLGHDGIFAERSDTTALADQLHRVLYPPDREPDLYKQLGQRLRQRAQQYFNWERTANQIVDTYGELTGGTASHPVAAPGWSVTRR